jgi:hypothetical protein
MDAVEDIAPFARLFEDGIADGSLTLPGGDPAEAAELLFNTVCWSYVHLRGRHRWPAERARHGLRRLMTPDSWPCRAPGRGPPVRDHECRAAPRRGRGRADLLPGARRTRLADVHVHFLPPGTRDRRLAPTCSFELAASSQSLRTRIRRYALADQRSYWSSSSSRYAPPSSIL